MLVKEFRQGLQQRMFLFPFAGIHVLMLFALWIEWQEVQSGTSTASSTEIFWTIIYVVLVVIMPLRGLGSLREECRDRNVELLIMAGLSRWQIVRGKWLVHVGLSALLLASLSPYVIVRYFFGGFDFWANLISLLVIMGSTSVSCALVLGASGYASYIMRTVVLVMTGIYQLVLYSCYYFTLVEVFRSGFPSSVSFLPILISACYLVLFIILTLIGLQLARGHLKVYLVPWEPPPTRTMMSILIVLPLILLFFGIATMGFGIIVAKIGMMLILLRYDQPSRGGGTSFRL